MLERGAVRLEEVRDFEPARTRRGEPREVPRGVAVLGGAGRAGPGRVGEVEVEAEGAEVREGGQDFRDVFLRGRKRLVVIAVEGWGGRIMQ